MAARGAICHIAGDAPSTLDERRHAQQTQLTQWNAHLRVAMAGTLIGIAQRGSRRAPMQEVGDGLITPAGGLAGDYKGAKYPRRQITILAREAWEAAFSEIGRPDLPWTARRANLLVEGAELPRVAGSVLRIGLVRLEVTGQTFPCTRMEEMHTGLLSALAKDWRGGVTCRVLEGGPIALGDGVEVLAQPPLVVRRLPG